MLSLIRSIFGLQSFDPQTMGEIAPAAWNAQPKATQAQRRGNTDDFRLVAITDAGDTAFSTKLKAVEDRTFEAPVRSGTAADNAGRTATLTRADLVELAKRNVSQATGEKIKPHWAKGGMSAAQIAKVCGVSMRTAQGAIGAFNAALTQVPAVAVVND